MKAVFARPIMKNPGKGVHGITLLPVEIAMAPEKGLIVRAFLSDNAHVAAVGLGWRSFMVLRHSAKGATLFSLTLNTLRVSIKEWEQLRPYVHSADRKLWSRVIKENVAAAERHGFQYNAANVQEALKLLKGKK